MAKRVFRSRGLTQSTQAGHLARDAELAEDLAIRYADVRRGPHSGHFEGWSEYVGTRDQCMAGLFQAIGRDYGATPEQVREPLGYRRADLDLAIILSFVGFYAWAANDIARRVCRSYQETWGRVVMIVYASLIASALGTLLGEVWSLTLENIRLGNGHLSYRVERIPWSHHRLGMFVGGIVLFWFLAALNGWEGLSTAGRRGQQRLAT
jgi:hypothetical protein